MDESRTSVVYGLYLNGRSRTLVYIGSALNIRHAPKNRGYGDRLRLHRSGLVRTTDKMAAKHGASTDSLRMRILRTWRENSPEHRIMRLCQAFGMARWNGPYAFSVADCRKAGQAGAGKILSEEHRAKLSAALMGHELSSETRAKISLTQQGRVLSAETRAKMSATRLGKPNPSARTGHPQTPMTRAKIRAAMLDGGAARAAEKNRGMKRSDLTRQRLREAWVRRRSK